MIKYRETLFENVVLETNSNHFVALKPSALPIANMTFDSTKLVDDYIEHSNEQFDVITNIKNSDDVITLLDKEIIFLAYDESIHMKPISANNFSHHDSLFFKFFKVVNPYDYIWLSHAHLSSRVNNIGFEKIETLSDGKNDVSVKNMNIFSISSLKINISNHKHYVLAMPKNKFTIYYKGEIEGNNFLCKLLKTDTTNPVLFFPIAAH